MSIKSIKQIVILLFVLLNVEGKAQFFPKSSVKLLFIGDVMGHYSQVSSAYNRDSSFYDYTPVFKSIVPLTKKMDFTIANLEVTLAGPPYHGYPQFSSPDKLAQDINKSGVNVLVTSNNHACDRWSRGVVRTVKVLNKLNIKHTGTFTNIADRKKNNLLILEKNGIKLGLLNYTYGTNGIRIKTPPIVNYIDKKQMLKDIKLSKTKSLDKLIVFIHWGAEYISHPNKYQKNIANFLFKNGVDIIIGSHPHVIQKMMYFPKTKNTKEKFIAYSLGNFVSAQRKRKTDGGVMVELEISKDRAITKISKCAYHLVWVNRYRFKKKLNYKVVLCSQFEHEEDSLIMLKYYKKINRFITDSRALLDKNNKNVPEANLYPEPKISFEYKFIDYR